jgi:RNA polymerase sigma-70 factor (ECF subfamily)
VFLLNKPTKGKQFCLTLIYIKLNKTFMSTAEFDSLVLNNAASLKPFAVSLTRDMETAKDLLQETLYKAFANREKYSAGTNVKAWLFTIMRNIFINDYRRKAKQKTIFNKADETTIANSSKIAVANDGEQTAGEKEINKAIHALPQIFKVPFLLYFEGYRYHEIAEAMNEPLGTIKSRIHFARKLLKEELSR